MADGTDGEVVGRGAAGGGQLRVRVAHNGKSLEKRIFSRQGTKLSEGVATEVGGFEVSGLSIGTSLPISS